MLFVALFFLISLLLWQNSKDDAEKMNYLLQMGHIMWQIGLS